jgi:hypothetical protein
MFLRFSRTSSSAMQLVHELLKHELMEKTVALRIEMKSRHNIPPYSFVTNGKLMSPKEEGSVVASQG